MTNQNLALRAELIALQDLYISTLDSDRLEAWPDLFVDDCLYQIIPKENVDHGFPAPLILCDNKRMLRDRVISLRHANIFAPVVYRHFFSGLVFEQDGEAIRMECNYLVISTSLEGVSTVYQAGTYRDIVVRIDGELRFKEKHCVFDTSRVQTLLALPI
ncbi:aromatic-ring-hydroxylating dioxygenase subunit beta [Novosphingobium profundi]|uniref:anthranilate 1,2-dioxygenase small subunit AndAd n=1 Tax=Novosphingobium profundi TaxID=1774954 RepID=UPI001BDA96E1|nr:anthranilate 1,2-dioxygenase small subunit AndAd [Novosphingobium profundi]MBT0667423.1 aromatic-ring-hydroxylating dioxygenase subunit beta [Novosphingobium profundi]